MMAGDLKGVRTSAVKDRGYPPGEGRLPVSMMAGDLKGVRTSAVKDRGGLLDGDHHWV
jgi:hypothetical protein